MINTEIDAISFNDNNVYLGLGDGGYLKIGEVDPIFNGQNGQKLRVVMEQQVLNGDFAEYVPNSSSSSYRDFDPFPGWTVESPANNKSVYNDGFSFRGAVPNSIWNPTNSDTYWRPGQSTINIEGKTYQAPLDESVPLTLGVGYQTQNSPIRTVMKWLYQPWVSPSDSGAHFSVENTGLYGDSYVYYARMYSDPLAALEGSTIEFDWYGEALFNYGEILSYAINLDTGEWHELLNETVITSTDEIYGNGLGSVFNSIYSPNDNGASLVSGTWDSYVPREPISSAFEHVKFDVPVDGRYSIFFAFGVSDSSPLDIPQVNSFFINNVEVTGNASITTNSVVE